MSGILQKGTVLTSSCLWLCFFSLFLLLDFFFFAGLPAAPLVLNASVSMREEAGIEQVGGRQ